MRPAERAPRILSVAAVLWLVLPLVAFALVLLLGGCLWVILPAFGVLGGADPDTTSGVWRDEVARTLWLIALIATLDYCATFGGWALYRRLRR